MHSLPNASARRASMAEKKEAQIVTVRDLATKLKIEPKRLRAIMRANVMHAKDGRYEWKQDDAQLEEIWMGRDAAMVGRAGKEKIRIARASLSHIPADYLPRSH